jgi:Fis family transcriptional regulator
MIFAADFGTRVDPGPELGNETRRETFNVQIFWRRARMAPRKKTRARREPIAKPATRAMPLRTMTAEALDSYFATLNGHKPGQLYELVLREVEEPLFKAVLDYAEGNQSRAADILGINRGTLRKKLKTYGLAN